MFKRVFLLVLTNILVMITLGVVLSILEVFTPLGRMLGSGDLTGLMILCLFWGFGGAFISLLISRWMAKRATGAQVINPDMANGEERWLVQTVHRLAEQAGIREMPEVAVYPSPEINAFATGPSKNSALVAVSAGLLQGMKHDEIEGVLGHEISHVANGDMVTMTLIQGVVNAFVMFLSELLVIGLMQAMRGNNERRREGGLGDFFLRNMLYSLLSGVLGFLAYLVVIAPFSRWREFRADRGGAEKAGKAKMIAALEALKALTQGSRFLATPQGQATPALSAFKISAGGRAWASDHPSLDDRIARLREL
jgi:heat shock protein HtpX